LSDDGDSQRLIRTFRGRGYRFTGAVERHSIESTSEDAEEAAEAGQLPEPSHRRKARRRVRPGFAVAGGLALLLLIAAVVSWYPATVAPPDPVQALAFEERDWVLISSFENTTGETLFDGTLEHALERTLVSSRFVNVVPPERIQDTLRLMKQPLDARIDVPLGREICLRDGAIRALLAGRAEKFGTTYVLSVRVVDPAQGLTVASLSAEAQGEDQIWPAIRRLASGVRASLGEDLALIRLSESKLAKVTTPSLRALQLYSQADALMVKGERAPATELLKLALAEDSEFASAYIHLAWNIWVRPGTRDEFLAHAERAWELAETSSERERYFIQGSYYHMRGEGEKAAASYEALLRVYPDHYWAMGNLAQTYRRLNRFEESVPYVLRRAELRPNSFGANVLAAQYIVQWGDGPAQAEPYLRRARALLSPEAEKSYPYLAAWVRLLPAHTHWLKSEVEEALSEVTRVGEIAKARTGPERQLLARWVANTYLTLGKLRAAEEIYRSFPDAPDRHHLLLLVALARGDEPAVREHLLGAKPMTYQAALFARAGLLQEAEKARQALSGGLISRLSPVCAAAQDKIVRGQMALARAQTAEAVRLLEDGASECPSAGSASLARALEQQGEWQSALRVLEEGAQERKVIYSTSGSGVRGESWLREQWQRAELLRKLGREPEAREIEAELRKLLTYADADHALLRKLRDLSRQEEVGLARSAE
jgi:tetratricopeptide (TPR) repeat protein